jgi:hypothetical protein
MIEDYRNEGHLLIDKENSKVISDNFFYDTERAQTMGG